jgi:hypothetical protein
MRVGAEIEVGDQRAPLRAMVLAQMIVGSRVDWHWERRALIDMVIHYLQNRS